jgi:hypothetical protein
MSMNVLNLCILSIWMCSAISENEYKCQDQISLAVLHLQWSWHIQCCIHLATRCGSKKIQHFFVLLTECTTVCMSWNISLLNNHIKFTRAVCRVQQQYFDETWRGGGGSEWCVLLRRLVSTLGHATTIGPNRCLVSIKYWNNLRTQQSGF